MKFVLALAAALTFAACSTPRAIRENDAVVVRNFTFPWSANPAPRTEFRAVIIDERLHFSFDAGDRDLVVAREWRGESTLDGEGRVEIFFARDAALARYCVEVDPLGRVHDYAAGHYRKFDSAWDFAGLRTRGQIAADGDRVSGSIPLQTPSTALGKEIGPGNTSRMGLFRAEFYGAGATARGEADDTWLSWVRPTAGSPDFQRAHRTSSGLTGLPSSVGNSRCGVADGAYHSERVGL